MMASSGKPLLKSISSQSLLGIQRKVRKTTKLEPAMQNISTNGVQVHGWQVQSGSGGSSSSGSSGSGGSSSGGSSSAGEAAVEFSCWDFGGQQVFYPTHQFFLTGRAIYVIVVNLLAVDLTSVEYWLQQIELMSNYVSTIVIVGSQFPLCR